MHFRQMLEEHVARTRVFLVLVKSQTSKSNHHEKEATEVVDLLERILDKCDKNNLPSI